MVGFGCKTSYYCSIALLANAASGPLKTHFRKVICHTRWHSLTCPLYATFTFIITQIIAHFTLTSARANKHIHIDKEFMSHTLLHRSTIQLAHA